MAAQFKTNYNPFGTNYSNLSKSQILDTYVNAVKINDIQTITALIIKYAGYDLDINTKVDEKTFLFIAADNNDIGMVKFLLDRKADPNIVDDYSKETPLHCAACNGNLEMVKLLVAAGADVNIKGCWDCTPLHRAAEGGNSEVFYTLIKAGADPNPENRDFCTSVLGAAIKFNCNVEIATALIALGANVNHLDVQGMSPLYLAVSFGPLALVRLLILKGADVNYDGNNGGNNTILEAAAQYSTPPIIQELIDSGATFNKKVYEQLLKVARIENKQFLQESYKHIN